MRVLLVGASGVLGRAVLAHLTSLGQDVVAITRTAGSVAADSLAAAAISELVTDVAVRRSFLEAVDGVHVDAVVNLLGIGALPPRYTDMREVNRLRIEGTSTLVAAARRAGARYVGVSPFYGYGMADHGDIPLTEADPFGEPDRRGTVDRLNDRRRDPQDAVQIALRSSEQQTRAFGGTVLRLGHLYAAGAPSVPAVPLRWSGALPVVHVEDAAVAVGLALTAPPTGATDTTGTAGRVYNVAADEPCSWRTLQEAQARTDGFAPPVVLPDGVIRSLAPFSGRIITRTAMRLSSAAAHDELGWAPRHAAPAAVSATSRSAVLSTSPS